MNDHNDWRVTIEFAVPRDDNGDWLDALLDATIRIAPGNVDGAVATGDLRESKVRVTFTVVNTTEHQATMIAKELQRDVPDAAGLSDVASIDATCA